MIPRRFMTPMKQIWELQWRLPKRNGNKAYRLLEHPRFRAGYDSLLLRETAGEQLDNLGFGGRNSKMQRKLNNKNTSTT